MVSPFSRRAAGIVATTSIFISAALACWLCWEYYHLYPPGSNQPIFVAWHFEWLSYFQFLSVNAGVLVDPQSVLLMIVVTVVSALIHLYSIGYMANDTGSGRYFTYLNLFTFSMLGLVVAPNILQLYIFWELVGVSSFLLIGYYYKKNSAVAASKKAFIVTRFADVFFLIGILLLGYHGFQIISDTGAGRPGMQAFDFLFLNHPDTLSALADRGILTTACLLIFVGAAGKSAMFPLHIWLPDAMEGPTPVSALIHAATMVVAGVYLVARLFPAFAASGTALTAVTHVGAFTCLFAAVIACAQNDIKRVLAFSTLSQLGYMMFALGVSSMDSALGYTASLFHLFTHAFFKALLFLGAGAVIHAVHSNEIWNMGGLARRMPTTHITFLIATLAIAGVPPLSGFFSKDLILASAWENHHPFIFALGLLVAGITAFYMFRIYFVAFWGKARSDKSKSAHEAPLLMLVPLIVLAAFSVVSGFVPMGEFVSMEAEVSEHEGTKIIPILATITGFIGITTAWLFYGGESLLSQMVVRRLGRAYTLIHQKFYIDEIYLFITHRVIFPYIGAPIAWFDRHVVDGAVNLSAHLTRLGGVMLSRLQTGQVQTYGTWLVNGAIIVALGIWIFTK